MKGIKMKIDEIKAQVNKIIDNSIDTAIMVYEHEDDKIKELGILNAKIAGRDLAIEYLYSELEKI